MEILLAIILTLVTTASFFIKFLTIKKEDVNTIANIILSVIIINL